MNRCKKCGGKLKKSRAIEQTWVGKKGRGHTMSPGGPGKMIRCWKCRDCGWSVTSG